MRIKDILEIKPITTVIDFESRDKTLIDSYVVLEDTSNYFLRILEGMTGLRDEDQVARRGSLNSNTVNRCHKIRGTYGIGKSYFRKLSSKLSHKHESIFKLYHCLPICY